MKPKDKAREIIYKFYEHDSIIHEMDGGGGIQQAKEYALIALDLIVVSIEYRAGMNPHFIGFEYWEKVKEEIKTFV